MNSYSYEYLLNKTDRGRMIFEHYFPQTKKSFSNNNVRFSLRNESNPSAVVRYDNDRWNIIDFGNGAHQIDAAEAVMMDKGITDFNEVCNIIGTEMGIPLEGKEPEGIVTFKQAKAEQKEGEKEWVIRDFTDDEVRFLCPHTSREILQKLGWYALESISIVSNRKVMTISSTVWYPIFIRECAPYKEEQKESFYKIYQPNSKKYKFTVYPDGTKPESYTNGLLELRNAYEEANKDEETKEKLDEAIICSGERDAICVASMGYHPIWFNSETYKANGREISEIMKYVYLLYNIPDIDETGIREGNRLALQYLDIYTVRLPKKMKGKDLRDWCDSKRTKNDFEKLLKNAAPARFWNVIYYKNGSRRYIIDPYKVIQFLQMNNYYNLKDFENPPAPYIHIDGYVVEAVSIRDIKLFLTEWAKENVGDIGLLSAIIKASGLNDTILSSLETIELDFTSFTKEKQLFFFENCSVEISGEDIIMMTREKSRLQNFVWAENVMQHYITKLKDMFSVTEEEVNGNPEFYVEIKCLDSKLLCYCINSSRLHWRKELERQNLLDKESQKEYLKNHRFTLKGEGLTEEEIKDQMTSFISKVFAYGYLLHRYKDYSRALAPICMDNAVSATRVSSGGSGKSFFFQILKCIRNTVLIDGASKLMRNNNFAFDQISPYTELVVIDDCFYGFDFKSFYNKITNDLIVNPKGLNSFTIPFKKSPKFAFTTNHILLDAQSSSSRRSQFLNFSDFYHGDISNDPQNPDEYSISDDFGGIELLDDNYPEKEWNADFNFIFQCERFYLSVKDRIKRINAPMSNIIIRRLLEDIGEDFFEWASAKFANTEGNRFLNQEFSREEVQQEYNQQAAYQIRSADFRKRLEQFCIYADWIECLNPSELCSKSKGNERRILRADGKGSSTEFFYIKTYSETSNFVENT